VGTFHGATVSRANAVTPPAAALPLTGDLAARLARVYREAQRIAQQARAAKDDNDGN
jgi:hypothetical protein